MTFNSSDKQRTSLPPETLSAALDLFANSGESHHITLRGFSMSPLIKDGDSVLVFHDFESVNQGDIVVFQLGSELMAHRVLYIHSSTSQGGTYLTKGDNSFQTDPPLSDENILGVVLAIRRGDRHLFLNTPVWRRVGRVVALFMFAQARLYHGGWDVDMDFSNHQPKVIPGLVCKIIIKFTSIFLSMSQKIIGSWK